jgi:hypothetical protein
MQGLDRRVTILVTPSLKIARKELVVIPLRDSPKMPACTHRHVDDTCCPHIDGSRIELFVRVLFGGNVGSRAAEAWSEILVRSRKVVGE